MQFGDFAEYLERLEKVSSRLEITKILAGLFSAADTSEIDKIVNLSLGRLAPSFEPIIFNVAEKMMIQAVAKAYKKEPAEITKVYKQKGDIGSVVFSLSSGSGSRSSVSEVYTELVKVAEDEGEGSVERKVDALAKLLILLDPLSAKFVARIPIGKLRLGFSDKTILDALSWMETGGKGAKKELDNAYQVVPDPAKLAASVKSFGITKACRNVTPVLGTPILPMLAQRLKSASEMIAKMGKVAVEPKFDGLRVQIHYKRPQGTAQGKGFVKAFTRNLNEVGWMFPELEKLAEETLARELIIDTEAVGLDEKRKTLANFQTTMTRRRKHEVAETAARVPIRFYVFDVLYLDGRSLIVESYLERRKALGRVFRGRGIFIVDDYMMTDEPSDIEGYVAKKIGEGLEGVMVKKLDSHYVPGRLGWRWVKMKQASGSTSKLADTVDCVVMGYSAGKGKRAGFGLGQFLVGVRSGGKYVTTTKIGTGLTDEQFRQLNSRLTKLVISQKPKDYEVHKNLEPDHWVKPSLVVEIEADEITKSPTHTAGLALRFPRLMKFRDDKSPAQATTLSELQKVFKLQKS